MRNFTFNFGIFLGIIFLTSYNSFAQRNEWLNQVITVNSGKFESTPPYTDYVTVQTYNPGSQQSVTFDVIKTQSAQDLVIKGNYAYVAAQDSIIMYNINNYQRVFAIADSGINKMFVYNNRLIISKQWPIKRFFVEVLDVSNLSLIARIQNISGDCAGITSDGDSIYVAIPGIVGTTEGKLAVISANTWSLKREINLGPDATGIWNLYNFNGHIFSINRTPIGGNPIGSISQYTLYNYTFHNKTFGVNFGDGIGIKGNFLYLNMNYGIGSLNLLTLQIADTTIIPDPGFNDRIFITSAGIEYVNGDIYLNKGNRISYGNCIQYSLAGDSITSYPTGINADALAFDYRTPVGIGDGSGTFELNIFPNPVNNELYVNLPDGIRILQSQITDITGRTCSMESDFKNNKLTVQSGKLKPGIYFLTLKTSGGTATQKFIKR